MQLELLFGDRTFVFLDLAQLLEFTHLLLDKEGLEVLLFFFVERGFLAVLGEVLLVLALLLLAVFLEALALLGFLEEFYPTLLEFLLLLSLLLLALLL